MNNWEIDRDDKWLEWECKIPELNFDSSWNVRIIPPFAGALIRFKVFKGDKYCSVFLDVFNNLGWQKKAYWGVLSYTDDEYEIAMDNVEELMKVIKSIVDGGDEH